MILAIETSEKICSVALFDEQKVIHSLEITEPYSHAESLIPLTDRLLSEAGMKKSELKATAVSAGPGSYTGLRIGISAAKGIYSGLGIPIIEVITLDIIFESMRSQIKEVVSPSLFVPMTDARRMEVYTAVFNESGEKIIADKPHILNTNTPQDLAFNNHQVYLSGSGAEKAYALLKNEYKALIFAENILPHARYMFKPALLRWSQQLFVEPNSYVPLYLKAFHSNVTIDGDHSI